MTTGNCVIELISKNDFNTKITVFNSDSNVRSENELYETWFQTVRRSLGSCIFNHSPAALCLSTTSEFVGPIYLRSTEDVHTAIRQCFDKPETFRIDITTPHNTTLSWVFALACDLIN